jgi:hypothetical protein
MGTFKIYLDGSIHTPGWDGNFDPTGLTLLDGYSDTLGMLLDGSITPTAWNNLPNGIVLDTCVFTFKGEDFTVATGVDIDITIAGEHRTLHISSPNGANPYSLDLADIYPKPSFLALKNTTWAIHVSFGSGDSWVSTGYPSMVSIEGTYVLWSAQLAGVVSGPGAGTKITITDGENKLNDLATFKLVDSDGNEFSTDSVDPDLLLTIESQTADEVIFTIPTTGGSGGYGPVVGLVTIYGYSPYPYTVYGVVLYTYTQGAVPVPIPDVNFVGGDGGHASDGHGGYIVGEGVLDLGGSADFFVIVDPSGIYSLVPGKKHDTLYERTGIDHIEVPIPNPFGKTALL